MDSLDNSRSLPSEWHCGGPHSIARRGGGGNRGGKIAVFASLVMVAALLWSALGSTVWASVAQPAAKPAPESRGATGDGWHVGSVRPRRDQPLQRAALCDFARLAAQQQALPAAEDPVFRQPSAEAKAALGRARKALIAGEPNGHTQLSELFRGPDGPTLARLALQDRDRKVQTAAAEAATPLAKQHPRLFAFLPVIDAATPQALALALLRMDFATGCDTPVLYALDALDHPAPEVVELALRLAISQASEVQSAAPVNRVVAWLERRSGPPRLRGLAMRLVGNLGLLHLSQALERLSRDADPLVAGEARVAWAKVSPGLAAKQLPAWWADPKPCAQLAALRAVAEIGAEQPEAHLPKLRAALANPALCRDGVTGDQTSVGSTAQAVLNYWDLK